MKLAWIRNQGETLIGEVTDLSSGWAERDCVKKPMVVQYVQMQAPARIHGQKPQMVTGFNLAPIPCSEIFLGSVSYWGEIKKNDPVYVTYYKVLESLNEQAASPLMVSQ